MGSECRIGQGDTDVGHASDSHPQNVGNYLKSLFYQRSWTRRHKKKTVHKWLSKDLQLSETHTMDHSGVEIWTPDIVSSNAIQAKNRCWICLKDFNLHQTVEMKKKKCKF